MNNTYTGLDDYFYGLDPRDIETETVRRGGRTIAVRHVHIPTGIEVVVHNENHDVPWVMLLRREGYRKLAEKLHE